MQILKTIHDLYNTIKLKQTTTTPESDLSQHMHAFLSTSYKIKVIIMLQNIPRKFLRFFFLTISFVVISRLLANLRFGVKATVLLVTSH